MRGWDKTSRREEFSWLPRGERKIKKEKKGILLILKCQGGKLPKYTTLIASGNKNFNTTFNMVSGSN